MAFTRRGKLCKSVEGQSDKQGGESEAQQAAQEPKPHWAYSPLSSPAEHEPATQKTENKPKGRFRGDKRWRHPQVIVNAALALITIIIATIYYFQLREMKKTAKAASDAVNQAERNSRLDQRAWISVHSAKLHKPLKVGDAPIVDFSITNSGKTPAVKGRMFGIILSADPNMSFNTPFDPSTSGANFTRFVIGPGRTHELTAPYGPAFPFSQQSDIDDIRNGKKCLFYIGHIFYEDVFGETHSTEFCAKMCSDLFESETFILCDDGNAQN